MTLEPSSFVAVGVACVASVVADGLEVEVASGHVITSAHLDSAGEILLDLEVVWPQRGPVECGRNLRRASTIG